MKPHHSFLPLLLWCEIFLLDSFNYHCEDGKNTGDNNNGEVCFCHLTLPHSEDWALFAWQEEEERRSVMMTTMMIRRTMMKRRKMEMIMMMMTRRRRRRTRATA